MNRLWIAMAVSLALTGCMETMPTKVDVDRSNPPTVASGDWYQPENKTERCLLPEGKFMHPSSGSRLYWEGACHGGYAVGLGRALKMTGNTLEEEIINHDPERKTGYGPYLYRHYGSLTTMRGYKTAGYADEDGIVEIERLHTTPNGDATRLMQIRVTEKATDLAVHKTFTPLSKSAVWGVAHDGLSFWHTVTVGFDNPALVTEKWHIGPSSHIEEGALYRMKKPGQREGIYRHVRHHPVYQDELPDDFWQPFDNVFDAGMALYEQRLPLLKEAFGLEDAYINRFGASDGHVMLGVPTEQFTAILRYYEDWNEKEYVTRQKYAAAREALRRQRKGD